MKARKLKSGFIWSYVDEDKKLYLIYKDLIFTVPDSKIRSLGCYINAVAWHRRFKKFQKRLKEAFTK